MPHDGKVLVVPSYIAGVTALQAPQAPQDAGSLFTFLGMIGWLTGNVPHLAEVQLPLVDALADAGKQATTKPKRALESVALTRIWGAEHDAALQEGPCGTP